MIKWFLKGMFSVFHVVVVILFLCLSFFINVWFGWLMIFCVFCVGIGAIIDFIEELGD